MQPQSADPSILVLIGELVTNYISDCVDPVVDHKVYSNHEPVCRMDKVYSVADDKDSSLLQEEATVQGINM